VTWVIVGSGFVERRPHLSAWYSDLGILIGGGLLLAILGSLFWRALDLPDRKRMLTWAPRKLNRPRPEVPAENPK